MAILVCHIPKGILELILQESKTVNYGIYPSLILTKLKTVTIQVNLIVYML